MFELAKIDSRRKSKMANGGWKYDAYPELESLDAGKTITIADIKGPAVITCFHITQHFYLSDSPNRKAIAARGIILEIYWNGEETPAVRTPLGDFFGDGLGGESKHFSSNFIEKAPESYNCYIPMPFEKSAVIKLTNETDINLMSYSFVEYETLPEWDDSYGYFHATWNRLNFTLDHKANIPMFHVDGEGQLIGRSFSISTTEPLFRDFCFVMEGNNEVRIDGEEMPSLNYLGTEDSFAFSWGFNSEYCGPYCGMSKIDVSDAGSRLAIYRFMDRNKIRFEKSLDLRINWSYEWITDDEFQKDFQRKLQDVVANGGAQMDYAITHYWYQRKIGFQHAPMQAFEDRIQ